MLNWRMSTLERRCTAELEAMIDQAKADGFKAAWKPKTNADRVAWLREHRDAYCAAAGAGRKAEHALIRSVQTAGISASEADEFLRTLPRKEPE
jgi:hypothetical protein